MKRLFFLALGMFTVGSSSFMMAGLLPKISLTLHQSIPITSQGITAFSLTYLFSAPFFSMLFANKSAKRILQLALIIFLLGNLLTLTANHIVVFLLGRVFTGLGAGIFNPLCVSVAMQLAGKTEKGKILSFIWGANSAGVVFGVPLGIYLSTKVNWQTSIAYVFVLGLVALIGLSVQGGNASLPNSSSLKERFRLLLDKNILAVITVTCCTALASLGLYSYVSLILGGTPHSLALTLFFWGLGGFTGSSLVGHFVDRSKKPRLVMAIILIGLAFTLFTIPFTKNLAYVGLISFFLWGMFGWAMPLPQQHILFQIGGNHTAVLSALNSSAIGLGSSLGTAIGGLVIASGFKQMNLPFVSAAILSVVFLGQLVLINKSRTEVIRS